MGHFMNFDDRGSFWISVIFYDENKESESVDDIYSYASALNQAQALAEKYGNQALVILYEYARFTSNKKVRDENLEIWWNEAYSTDNDREPKRRGYGFYSPEVGRKRWVEYEAVVTALPPEKRYKDSDVGRHLDDTGHFSLSYSEEEKPDVTEELLSFVEAKSRAETLSENDKLKISLSEYGEYNLDGETWTGTLLFWWGQNLNSAFKSEPIGRGVGWLYRDDDSPALIRYEPSEPGKIEETDDEDEVDEVDDEEYEKASCENCGVIKPLYALSKYSWEEEVARSSGSTRVGYSSGRRHSSTGRSSNTNRSSVSRSSGRTFYATHTALLCEGCYSSQIAADEQEDAEFWAALVTWGKWIAIAVVALIVLFSIFGR